MPQSAGETRHQYNRNLGIDFPFAGKLQMPGYWQGKRHSHHFFEQLYINSGSLQINTANLSCVANAGDMVLIPPDIRHAVCNSNSDPAVLFYIGFRLSPVSWDRLPEFMIFHADINCSKAVAEAVSEKYREELAVPEMLNSVQLSLQQLKKFAISEPDFKPNSIINEACNYIDERPARTLKVRELAAQLYISPNYFGEMFKQETGMTPKQYHNLARMRKAWQLLRYQQMNVAEVSEQLGFSAPEYFSRQFKKHFGIPPVKIAGAKSSSGKING